MNSCSSSCSPNNFRIRFIFSCLCFIAYIWRYISVSRLLIGITPLWETCPKGWQYASFRCMRFDFCPGQTGRVFLRSDPTVTDSTRSVCIIVQHGQHWITLVGPRATFSVNSIDESSKTYQTHFFRWLVWSFSWPCENKFQIWKQVCAIQLKRW
jgi:hypothetical protein